MDDRQAILKGFTVPDSSRIGKVHAWLRKHGRLTPTGRRLSVLEIGYAPGGLLERLDGANVEKVAVDINERDVPHGVTFHRHDCNEPFHFAKAESFDVVFAGEVIEHMYDDGRFLREIHRVLAPNGIVALTTPNLFFLVNRVVMPFGHMPHFAYAPYHYHFYSRETLTALAKSSGFEVVHLTASHVLVSSRGPRLVAALSERLGDVFPSVGAHLILFAVKA
jgi:SAM-dependent methyltransferase